MFTTGRIDNRLELRGDSVPGGSLVWDESVDTEKPYVSAGRYIHVLDDANDNDTTGEYIYHEGGFDVLSTDWASYLDHDDPSNIWVYEAGKPSN